LPRQALANALFSVWDSLGKVSGFAFGALLPDSLPSESQHTLGSSAFGSSAQQRLDLSGHIVPGQRALFEDCRALFGFSILAMLATQVRKPGVAL
jgi:solute carrier family 45 protein 1/2/4|tara:strand:- start:95 stop:379 length:285 start_codon:yes stop_codon:yes gene_type:complete